MTTKTHGQFRCICGGTTQVTDSRPTPRYVRRRRECKRCGIRFTTHEQIVKWDNVNKLYEKKYKASFII